MSNGNKPVTKIGAKHKDAPRGTRSTPILAIWKGQYGYNVSLDKDVAEIVLKDGTVIRGSGREGTHWLDMHAFETLAKSETRGSREVAAKDEALADKYGDDYGSGGDDSIPFAPRDEWGA